MRYQAIDPQLFIKNRQRFVSKLKKKSLAIFYGHDRMPRSADQHFRFRQQSDLFYLTGIEQESTILLLFPDAPTPENREILLLAEGTAHSKIWLGEQLTKDEAKATSGIEKISWLHHYETIVHELMLEAKEIYLNFGTQATLSQKIDSKDRRMGIELMQTYPMHKYRSAVQKLKNLRMIKSDTEVQLIKKAIDITGQGFKNILTGIKPKMWEYQLEAILAGSFLNAGASGHAYEPIVACGKSACILHYVENDRRCRDGELVLLDFGAEYANYAADISRTIPVNGRFTERQSKIYQSVLHVLKETKSIMQPGITLKQLNLEVAKMMNHALIDLGLLSRKEIPAPECKDQPYRRYFMHGVAHHLGLDVHDIGDRSKPLQTGMVLTCEPGIYIAEEGIGVRLENDILISDEEPLDLAEEIPIEIEEIEMIMQQS